MQKCRQTDRQTDTFLVLTERSSNMSAVTLSIEPGGDVVSETCVSAVQKNLVESTYRNVSFRTLKRVGLSVTSASQSVILHWEIVPISLQ